MSQWTFKTLIAHFEALRVDDQRAVAETKSQLEKRLEGMNEFRDALSDQAKLLASRVELDALEKRVQELTDRLNKNEGRAVGLRDGWGWLVGAVSVVGALAVAYFKR